MNTRRLPNWLALALLATGLGYALATADTLGAAGLHAAHAAIALLVGMGLFALGVVGGGDAKFYAGMAAWFPLSRGTDLLIWVAVLGGVFAILWLVFRRIRPRNGDAADDVFTKFPYGVAIAAGGMVTAWTAIGSG